MQEKASKQDTSAHFQVLRRSTRVPYRFSSEVPRKKNESRPFRTFAVAAAMLAFFAPHFLSAQISYRSSWVGNTFPGGYVNSNPHTGNWVQDSIQDAFVLADGTVITNSNWDERGCEACVYKDGVPIQPTNLGTGGFLNMHAGGGAPTMAVVASGNNIYLTSRGNFGLFDVKSRNFVSGTPGFVAASSQPLAGLGLGNGEVYVSAPGDNQIKAYNATTLAPLRTFSFTAPGKLTVDQAGTLWIIQTSTNTIFNYTSTGTQRGSFQLPNAGKPTALAIDNQGRLMVGDSGPSQQVLFYAIGGTPSVVATFGAYGGIWSGSPGATGDLKLINPVGVGTDSSGNIYVASTLGGSSIKKFSPSGALLWHVEALVFVDGSAADSTTDGQDIYTARGHYAMDYSRSAGAEWSWKGMSINPFLYPTDPRMNGISRDGDGAGYLQAMRSINGIKYIYVTDQYAGYLMIFRLSGETAIPSAIFAPVDKFSGSGWLTGIIPSGQAWMWRDSGGDGNIQANEIYNVGGEQYGIKGWYVDAKGNIWQAHDNGNITMFAMQGVDSFGNPQYDQAHVTTLNSPTAFTDLERIVYDAVNDTMYLSGYTPGNPSQGGEVAKFAGTVFARYNNWSTGNRTAATTIQLPYPNPANEGAIISWDVAGSRLFAGLLRSRGPADSGPSYPGDPTDAAPHNIFVFDLNTGALLGEMLPGPEIGGQMGWLDATYSVHAFQRSTGEYIVTEEEVFSAKQIMYRMDGTPPGQPPPPPPPPTSTIPIRVNAGGLAYTDAAGQLWSADTGFTNGNAYSIPNVIGGTSAQPLYQSSRWNSGSLQYQFAVPNGSYQVNLKFAEPYYTAAGQRVFSVSINGAAVLSNFDILQQAGGIDMAIDRPVRVTVTGGQIRIVFTPVIAEPTVSAIEIIIPPLPVTVSVTPGTATLTGSQTQQFTAALINSAAGVTWSISPGVGTISATGLYQAPSTITSAQAVTITATSVSDISKSANSTVTLQMPPIGVSVTPSTSTLTVSQTQQFSASVVNSAAGVTWTISPVTGTISGFGLYTAPSAIGSVQTVTVTATSTGDNTKSAKAAITLQPPPIAVTVSPGTATLAAAQTQQFSASVANSTAGVTWSISPNVGTVSTTGLYKAPATIASRQSVTVTAVSTADKTKLSSATVTLTPPVAKFTPLRVNAGGPSYTDSLARMWAADTGYIGGNAYDPGTTVSATTAAVVYQTERWADASFQYQFKVPNGAYSVNLKFAELYYTQAGQRVFNISINNQTVASNFDVLASAGGVKRAVDRKFAVTATNGQINIAFTAVAGQPAINAIEITAP